ncbi:MAG: recombination mediator RecR [Pseudomonadota bacterium]
MSQSALLNQLVDALRCLPGVGPKSAQRMAFHVLEHDREGALRLASTLEDAVSRIGRCQRCRTFSETPLCQTCSDPNRDQSLICVVESPIDVAAVEQATGFRGTYFVLMGRLSPLDGIGPEELALDQLTARLKNEPVKELIIATNLSVEGEATAQYLSQLARSCGVSASRIAHGVPLGGELEYTDASTLAHAFAGRRVVEH